MKHVVAVGGGTGMPVLIKSLLGLVESLDAIVTVADDGGSSGKLREELSGFPPGDSRNCLVAMADDSVLADLFQYRFSRGEGLRSHALGNLIIAALVDITGDYRTALETAGDLLGAKGRVMPPSLEPLTLYAEVEPWANSDNGGGPLRVVGQCNVANRLRPLSAIGIEPKNADACPEAVAALEAADTILLGPGSLHTSVIANLLVSGIGEAIRRSRAKKIFLCNITVQQGETDGYTGVDHLDALAKYGGVECDLVISSDTGISNGSSVELFGGLEPVRLTAAVLAERGVDHLVADLTDEEWPTRHDPEKLAQLWRGAL